MKDKVKVVGFVILLVGVIFLVLSAYFNNEFSQYLSVMLLIIGALLMSYDKLLKANRVKLRLKGQFDIKIPVIDIDGFRGKKKTNSELKRSTNIV